MNFKLTGYITGYFTGYKGWAARIALAWISLGLIGFGFASLELKTARLDEASQSFIVRNAIEWVDSLSLLSGDVMFRVRGTPQVFYVPREWINDRTKGLGLRTYFKTGNEAYVKATQKGIVWELEINPGTSDGMRMVVRYAEAANDFSLMIQRRINRGQIAIALGVLGLLGLLIWMTYRIFGGHFKKRKSLRA